ncbi:membrane-bound O-acyltransferase family protein [Geomonas silvestris]|uniref:Membrane-bound O-acyltransferase family protein n=1 Tax=Geomonas silvestris TaxID=2740184 RepID=A0A6V8MLP9_9BACT|nr:MBOAT family O-acyltransferase [Geomonas silvestris]GFO60971.1 membrane-bound O-acyltransferase family protein [Geomonas silvestris]
MTFNTLSYFFFLPASYLAFYLTADRWRWLVLLLASYGFYACLKAPYLLAVLFAVTTISYCVGLKIAQVEPESLKRRWLFGGCLACIGTLAAVKCLPLLATRGGTSGTLISVGVSYFSFQAVSYLADIYLEIEEPERDFGRFALYLAFFPKLLQGPIERGGDLLPQLKKPYRFDYDTARSGLVLFGGGLFKKVVVADWLGLYADQVYNNVHDYTGVSLLVATYAYALQIYFDFSSYTDMARGTARLFGIELTENFNAPYRATSVAEFWRRWHISFSRWILDYIFKPLQLSWRHAGQLGSALALVVTFLISGLWHGVGWTFVIWGLLHGSYLAASNYYRPYQKRLYQWLGVARSPWLSWWKIFVTFHLVSFAWVFFRANTLSDALYVARNLFDLGGSLSAYLTLGSKPFYRDLVLMGVGENKTYLQLLCIALVLALKKAGQETRSQPALRWVYYLATALACLNFGIPNINKFIYMQF